MPITAITDTKMNSGVRADNWELASQLAGHWYFGINSGRKLHERRLKKDKNWTDSAGKQNPKLQPENGITSLQDFKSPNWNFIRTSPDMAAGALLW